MVYIGFVYKAESAANYTTYRIDNVIVGEATSTPDKPDQPDQPDQPTGEATYRLATSITSGSQYVLVVDGQVGGPISQSLSYGRFAMNSVTIANGEFKAPAENAFTLTAVTGGYTMVDACGRYLSMDATHFTSFQLYSSQEAGSVWSISVDAQGVATIVNNLNPNCNVVRSGTYSNIAPSDIVQYTQFDRPTIYELVK